jgi:hypothetical protein
MRGLNKNRILQEITRFYLDSPDFNGISSAELSRRLSVRFSELFDFLMELISEGKVGILYVPTFINPHIIRRGFEPESKQIERLVNPQTRNICLYPRSAHLQETVNRSEYQDKPYALELALGSPQLAHRPFDFAILEHYRNDPRYTYQTDDIKGHICYNSDQMPEHNQTMLESFGFSYDSDLNRAVAVFVRYLARLSPEHQQIWKAHELIGDYDLHPDYHKNAVVGEWREHESIFTAFVKELHLICQMTVGMNRPSLFRTDYGENRDSKPKKLGFLVRPTLEEFNSFVHLLDKMISENINKKFFQREVPYETETERKDGKIQVEQKGTLQILDDWVRRFFRPADGWQDWNEAIQAFREVRKKRQRPGHAIDENVFNQKYFKEQRELMIGAYEGMRTLRMALENHPKIKELDIDIPDYLREAKIWTY